MDTAWYVVWVDVEGCGCEGLGVRLLGVEVRGAGRGVKVQSRVGKCESRSKQTYGGKERELLRKNFISESQLHPSMAFIGGRDQEVVRVRRWSRKERTKVEVLSPR